jgi:flavonoid 3'-monooxygenase
MYDDMMNGIIRETKATEEGKDLLDMLLDWMREHWPLAEDDDSRISDTDIAAKECEVDRF